MFGELLIWISILVSQLVLKHFIYSIAEHGSIANKYSSLCRSYVQFVELVFGTFEHISELYFVQV